LVTLAAAYTLTSTNCPVPITSLLATAVRAVMTAGQTRPVALVSAPVDERQGVIVVAAHSESRSASQGREIGELLETAYLHGVNNILEGVGRIRGTAANQMKSLEQAVASVRWSAINLPPESRREKPVC
jgi:hypothetical protein